MPRRAASAPSESVPSRPRVGRRRAPKARFCARVRRRRAAATGRRGADRRRPRPTPTTRGAASVRRSRSRPRAQCGCRHGDVERIARDEARSRRIAGAGETAGRERVDRFFGEPLRAASSGFDLAASNAQVSPRSAPAPRLRCNASSLCSSGAWPRRATWSSTLRRARRRQHVDREIAERVEQTQAVGEIGHRIGFALEPLGGERGVLSRARGSASAVPRLGALPVRRVPQLRSASSRSPTQHRTSAIAACTSPAPTVRSRGAGHHRGRRARRGGSAAPELAFSSSPSASVIGSDLRSSLCASCSN